MTSLTDAATVPANNKLFGLDHLRAVAIIMVFVFHYGRLFAHPQWVTVISKFGWTGVDLFFVLSGYLIASQLFATITKGKALSFKTFFIKRFFRIIPAYVVVVALYFLFPSFREREGLAPLWKYVTFTQNLGLDLHSQGTFSHAWSLCIEEQFYLFFPLVLIALVNTGAVKKGYWLLLGLFIFGFFARLYAWHYKVLPFAGNEDGWANWYEWIYYPTYSRLDGLLAGVSIAAGFEFYPQLTAPLKKYGNLLLLLSVLVLTAAYFVCLDAESYHASIIGFPLVSLGYGLMVMGAISATSLLYRFRSSITSTIASWSYVLYLTHKIIIHLTQIYVAKLGINVKGNAMLLICIITSLFGAWCMHKIIEKPFQQLRNKLLHN